MNKYNNGGSAKPKPPRGSAESDDVLITTPRGKRILEEQRRREAEAERKRREKQDAADKLLGIGAKKGGMMKMADKAGRAMTRKTADTMGRAMVKKAGGGKCYAKGGTASARADGIAKKGKTKGKMLAMGGLGSAVSKSAGAGLGSAVKGAMKSSGSGLGSVVSNPMGGSLSKMVGKAPSQSAGMSKMGPPQGKGAMFRGVGRKKGGKC